MTASICDIENPADQDEGHAEERRRRLVEQNYNRLYRLHARPLFRYLLRLTLGDRREAEDYLQETFLRTWRWLQEHTIDPEIMRPWLYTVARRIFIDAVRARQARPTEVPATDLNRVSQPDNDIDRLVQVHALRRAMLSLSPEHRATLIEIFYHERTAKEAAEILGIPEGTVKSRAHYAVQALRQATQAEEWEGHAAKDGPKPTREGRYRSADSRTAPAAA